MTTAMTHTLALEQAVLAKNDHLADHNRTGWLGGLTAINVMSSPGAGKTTLLERTIIDSGLTLSVIEGDQETTVDAERIRAAGARSVQVNTGAGCHLDAAMVRRALDQLQPQLGSWRSRTSATLCVRRCSTSARPARSSSSR